MASHSSPPSKKPRVPPPCPNWLDLPADVSASIFRRLNTVEILTSAQHVCSTWRRVCRDPSMWRSINIRYRSKYGDARYSEDDHGLTELYKRAVDWSSGGLLNVNMVHAPDGLLRYITKRSNNLRRLCLFLCDAISDLELFEAAGRIPLLEELDLSYCHFSSELVAAIGRLCPLLHTFKLNSDPCRLRSLKDDFEAFAIARNMPGLHHLQIFGNKLTDVGLIEILDGCKQLESLDFRKCFQVNLDADLKRRCTEQIKHVRCPNDSTDDYPFDLTDDDDLYASSDAGFWSDSEGGEVNGGLSDDDDGHASSDAGFWSDMEDGEVNGGLSHDDDGHVRSDAGVCSDREDGEVNGGLFDDDNWLPSSDAGFSSDGED